MICSSGFIILRLLNLTWFFSSDMSFELRKATINQMSCNSICHGYTRIIIINKYYYYNQQLLYTFNEYKY